MLGPGRYLLGVAEVLLLLGAAGLGAWRLRRWLLPSFGGAPALLATLVLTAALLIWPAELLGSFGLFKELPYLVLVVGVGVVLWTLLPAGGAWSEAEHVNLARRTHAARQDPPGRSALIPTVIALLIAALAVLHFAAGVKTRLGTGMTGFDSTWYHGPFAAGFFQSGDTWHLHFIAPQFLAWFYPANGEIFHAAGMLAFGRDVLSPLLNLGWFGGCLLACWCIGRPFGAAPWSLALGAIALSVPALADQAGEARNDIVGIFFLLAGVAVALNAWAGERVEGVPGEEHGPGLGPYLVIGLAAGLAAGTKLNFLLPAAVLVVGLATLAPRPSSGAGSGTGRLAAFLTTGMAALAGGGYWYLRNLAHAGNPLPWIRHLGPIALPAPGQALGGREGHSVFGYLGDGNVWSGWFLPGLHQGLWIAWPLLLAAALAGLALSLIQPLARRAESSSPGRRGAELSNSGRRRADKSGPAGQIDPSAGGLGEGGVLAVAGLVGFAAALAWLIAPTSASGPAGMPRGFESGLRYLAPALVLGLALLPTAPALRRRIVPASTRLPQARSGRRLLVGAFAALALAVAAGYPIQRHYLQNRYKDPTFTAPGLNAAFAWARNVSGARIATTSTRQYPLFGTDLSNHVQYLGIPRPHGGFEPPTNCSQYRRLLNKGHYDYAVATYDREEPGNPSYPPSAAWTKSPQATVVLRKPPTVVYKLTGPLNPSACTP